MLWNYLWYIKLQGSGMVFQSSRAWYTTWYIPFYHISDKKVSILYETKRDLCCITEEWAYTVCVRQKGHILCKTKGSLCCVRQKGPYLVWDKMVSMLCEIKCVLCCVEQNGLYAVWDKRDLYCVRQNGALCCVRQRGPMLTYIT